MDVRQKIQPAPVHRVLSITFNDDKSAFAIGLETGFWVLQSADGTPILKKELMSGIGLAQMMGISNILALVGGGVRPKFAGNRVIMWDESKQSGSTEIETLTPIRAVKLKPGKIIVALQNCVQVHGFNRAKLLHRYPTADNLDGILCVSEKQMAFPGRVAGQIQIVEFSTSNISMIIGHDAPLRALCFSQDGEMLASASEKGTMIHIYNTRNCAVICEVRRGMDQAHIFDLCFSPSGALLACTSDKGTLHIFDVPSRHGGPPPTAAALAHRYLAGGGGSRPSSSSSLAAARGGGISSGGGADANDNGWGWLARVPLLPKAFSDQYSFASAKFALGEEPAGAPDASDFVTLGTTKPQKGVIGWYNEADLVVVGAGFDARWEKFRMAKQDSGKRFIARIGWKRYYNENQ